MAPGFVEIRIYDVLGYRVRDLSGSFASGNQVLNWNGDDLGGARVESGVYWILVRPAGEQPRTLRLAVTR